jgi:hypothetical protein
MNYGQYDVPPPPKSRTGLIVVLVFAGLIVASIGWVLAGFGMVRASLTDDGYTDVKVSMRNPFTFSFDGKKGDSSCSGTITRLPGSMSREELCFSGMSGKSAVPAPPPPSNRESIEKSLREHYAETGFDTFTCPEIANADTKATCKMSSSGGVQLDANVTRTAAGTAGDWQSWHIQLDALDVESGDKLGAKLSKAIASSVASRHPNIALDVDCGKGPIVFVAGKKITCSATSHDDKPLHATITVEDKPDGGITWTEKGL